MAQSVTLSKGATTVTISTASVAGQYRNRLIKINKAVSKSNQGTSAPETIVYDLKRTEFVFEVTGFLITDASTADAKWDLLLKGLENTGNTPLGIVHKKVDPDNIATYPYTVFTWGTRTYNVHIETVTFKEDATRPLAADGTVDKYSISLTLVVGTVK